MTAAEPVTHGSFRIERTYAAPPARVFAAFADPATKRRWFAEGEGWEIDTFTVDFRVHGRERARFRRTGTQPVITNETVYFDIVADRRIAFAYGMTIDGTCISASVATVELAPAGSGTTLVYTEQGAFFGDPAAVGHREVGCRDLFDRLAAEIGVD
jgi:uncharacterized protein YndB with AHSA1/START domain